MSNACGADFDMSGSTADWLRPDAPALLPFEGGKATPLSVILFHTEDLTVSYGRVVLANYLTGYEGRLMRSLKSLLDISTMDDSTEVMGRAMPLRRPLVHLIGELKRHTEHAAGHEFRHAVLGRPVFFIDEDPKADQFVGDTLVDIMHDADFDEIAFRYEPIIATFGYGAGVSGEELVLVADIGGDTSDFLLMCLSSDHAKRLDCRDNIPVNGGTHIGGTDFDRAPSLVSMMSLLDPNSTPRDGRAMPSGQCFDLASRHMTNHMYTRRARAMVIDDYWDVADTEKLDRLIRLIRECAGYWLVIQMEAAKIVLSDASVTETDLHRIAPELKQPVTHEDFDQSIGKLVDKTISTVQAVLKTADVAAEKVDAILLASGSSGVPSLREQLVRVLPSTRRVEGDLLSGTDFGLVCDVACKFG